jgi:ATP-dependent Clp protease ATP-binding subunit ClpX
MSKNRNAFCSYCRKSYKEVGPLVEGPGDVYICAECIELCQSIIDQELRRRAPPVPFPPELETIQTRLDQLVSERAEVTKALAFSAHCHYQLGSGETGTRVSGTQILLAGASRSGRILLARALAHVLAVPFAEEDPEVVVKLGAHSGIVPFFSLLQAADFDVKAAQRGVIYLDGIERHDVQQTLLRLWSGEPGVRVPLPYPPGVPERFGIELDIRGILFICGTGEAAAASGLAAELAKHFTIIAGVQPLDEAAMLRIVRWVDFGKAAREEKAGFER